MAKITLENNQRNAFHINVPGKTGIKRVEIPAAKPDKETKKLVNGRVEADAEIVETARKNSPVVRSYFANGWLREIEIETEKEKTQAA